MSTARPRPVKGIFRKFAHECEELTTEIVTIVGVSLSTLLPIAFTIYSLFKLGELVMSVAANPAHPVEADSLHMLGDVIDAIMPKVIHTIFEFSYEATHTSHDWRATKLKISEYLRLAKIERRRLKYLWRAVRKAAAHLVHVLLRFARLKVRRAGLIKSL